MPRIAVVIPGIMGSELWTSSPGSGRQDIWSADMRATYTSILQGNFLLHWSGQAAEAKVLRDIRFPPIPGAVLTVWGKIEKYLDAHGEFSKQDGQVWFGYDWRDSLINTARRLKLALDRSSGEDVSVPPPIGSETKFQFFAHSMGGLVLRTAVGERVLHPSWIDRIFYIGSPLRGSPEAFNKLYGKDLPLPYIKTIFQLIAWKNKQQFINELRKALRTFPSVYQLLPQSDWAYIHESPFRDCNPLKEDVINRSNQEYARQVHEAATRGKTVLEQENVNWFAICVTSHSKRPTDVFYQTRACQDEYEIISVLNAIDEGDGVVPLYSASDCYTSSPPRLAVVGVDHGKLCDADSVVALLRTHDR